MPINICFLNTTFITVLKLLFQGFIAIESSFLKQNPVKGSICASESQQL